MITNQADLRVEAGQDATLGAVADPRRRIVLRTLAGADGEELDVATLVDRVADSVDGEGNDDEEHRRSVHSSLHHVHLPKLEACELIEYDHEAGRVRRVPDDVAEECLAVVDEADVGN